jgi:hypothetical protein
MDRWQTFWVIPAVFALAIMAIFAALFRDTGRKTMEPTLSPGTLARDAAIEPNP